jgi:hypothetical protein
MNDSTAHNLDAYTHRRQVDELNADLARLRDQVNYSLQGSHYFQIRKRSDFSFRELTGRSGLLDVVKFLIQTSLCRATISGISLSLKQCWTDDI